MIIRYQEESGAFGSAKKWWRSHRGWEGCLKPQTKISKCTDRERKLMPPAPPPAKVG